MPTRVWARRNGRRHRAREEREVESASGPATGPHSGRPGAHERAGHHVAVRCAVRSGGAHRWALVGRIHGGGDGRRTAHEYAGAVVLVPAIMTGLFGAPAFSDHQLIALQPRVELFSRAGRRSCKLLA